MTDDLHDLAAAYVLDALDDDERDRFEAHLVGCAACRTEVRELREVAALLAAEDPVAPPAALRESVLAEVDVTEQAPAADERPAARPVAPTPTARATRPWPTLAAAAVLVLVLALGALVLLRDDPGGSELAELLAAPDAVTVELEGEPSGTLRVVYSESEDRAALVGAGLDPAGTDSTYQLWAIRGDEPLSAGVFDPDDPGDVDTSVELPAERPDLWAVTIEPDGGSPAPTGDILFSGTPA